MNVLSKLTHITRKGLLLGAVTAALVGAGLFISSRGSVSADTPYNCDGNAVIYCGSKSPNGNPSVNEIIDRYNHGDGHNSAASIHNIYGSSVFGISNSDIQNLGSISKNGYVTKSGDVYLGNTLVATDAISGGREYIAGSKSYSNNGTKFYVRSTQGSFLSNSISAYVVVVNGQFKFAILTACGNPVIAKPIPVKKPCPPPIYTCDELKGDQIDENSFNFTIKATGQNGADIQGYGFDFNDGSKQTVNSSASSYTIKHTYANPGTYHVTATAFIKVNGQVKSVTSEACETTVTVCPPPVAECTNLTADENTRTQFTFNAKAYTANGATISGYVFNYGDGTHKTVSTAADHVSIQHSYTSPNTYNVTVAVLAQMNGQTKTITSAACATTVKVCPPPAAECTDLKLEQNATNPREVAATVTYTTSNGATLSGVSFNWGDSSSTPASMQTSANHTYQADGPYTVVATLTFNASTGAVPNSTCQASVTVTTVTPTCNELDIDVDNTSKTVTVKNLTYTANDGTYEFTTLNWGDASPVTSAANAIGQSHQYSGNGPYTVVATTHFTVNGTDSGVTSQACQQPVNFTTTPPVTPPTTPPVAPPVTPPTQLVNTGAGNVIGLFAAVTIAGVAGYHWFLRRRLSHNN